MTSLLLNWLFLLCVTSSVSMTARVAARSLHHAIARKVIVALACVPAVLLSFLFRSQEHVISKGTASFAAFLAFSKLILFAFDRGPLDVSELSTLQFVLSTLLFALPFTGQTKHLHAAIKVSSTTDIMFALILHMSFAFACLLMYAFVESSSYFASLLVFFGLYSLLASEMYSSSLVLSLIGVQTCLPFNLPFLSRSIASFWNRWNITTGLLLRQLAYDPTVQCMSKRFNKHFSRFCGLLSAFAVSAFLHTYVLGNMAMTDWPGQARLALFFLIQPILITCEQLISSSLRSTPACPRIAQTIITLAVQFACAHTLFVKPFVQNSLTQQISQNIVRWCGSFAPSVCLRADQPYLLMESDYANFGTQN